LRLNHQTFSLRTYLYFGLGSILLTFVVAAVGLREFVEGRVLEQADAQVRSLSRYRAQQALLLVLLDQEVGLRSYLATGDLVFLEAYEKGRRAQDDAIRTIIDNLPEHDRRQDQDQVTRIQFLIAAWDEKAARPLIMARLKGPVPDLKAAMALDKAEFDAVKLAAANLQTRLDDQDEQRLRELDNALALARWIALASYGAVLLAGFTLSRWLLAKVADPLSELADQAHAGDGFTEPGPTQPVKEVEILGRALYALDKQSRDRETVLRQAHDEALATRAFEELVQHLSREEDLLQALDQALARQLHTSSQRILLRPEVGDGLLSFAPPMTPEEAAGHRVMVEANLCRAIHQGSTVDLQTDAPTACICPLGVPGAGAYLCIPLVASGMTVGLVNLQARNPGHWTPARRRVAEALVSASAAALQAIRALDLARERSIRDALTGSYNRRFLDEFLPKMADQAVRRDSPLSLLMLDIDHFKIFNDEFGHEGGDCVLKLFAQSLQDHVRGGDMVARFGGEEFAVLLPHAGPELALGLAERLRRTIEEMPLPEPQFPHARHISASIGVATFPDHTLNPGDLLTLADQALYEAKGSGRNRSISAGALGHGLLAAHPMEEEGKA